MSARKTGTPWPESCSAISCSVLVLPVPVAPATRPCRFRVRQRDAHRGVGVGRAVDHRGPEVQGAAFEGVPGADLVELLAGRAGRLGGRWRWRRLGHVRHSSAALPTAGR